MMRDLLSEEFGAEFKRIKLDESSERSCRQESFEAFGVPSMLGKEINEGLGKDQMDMLLGGEMDPQRGSHGSTPSPLYNEHRIPATNLFL